MQSSDQDLHKDPSSPTLETKVEVLVSSDGDDNASGSTISLSFSQTTTVKPSMEPETEAIIIHVLETVQGETSELITEYLPDPPVEGAANENDSKTILTSDNLSLAPSDEVLGTTLNPSPDSDFNINTIPEHDVIFNPVTTTHILFTTATTVSLGTEESTLTVTTDSSITLQPSTEPNDFTSDVTDSNEIPEVLQPVNTGMIVEKEEETDVMLIEPVDETVEPEEVTVATEFPVEYYTLQPDEVETDEGVPEDEVAEPEKEESKDPTGVTEVQQPHLIEPKEGEGDVVELQTEADGSNPSSVSDYEEKINTEEPDVGTASEVHKSTEGLGEPPVQMIKIEPPRISVTETYPIEHIDDYQPEETPNLPFVPPVSAQPKVDISKPEPEVIEEAPEIPFIGTEETADDVQSTVSTATDSLLEKMLTESDSEKHKDLPSGESEEPEVLHTGEGLIHKHRDTETLKTR